MTANQPEGDIPLCNMTPINKLGKQKVETESTPIAPYKTSYIQNQPVPRVTDKRKLTHTTS